MRNVDKKFDNYGEDVSTNKMMQSFKSIQNLLRNKNIINYDDIS